MKLHILDHIDKTEWDEIVSSLGGSIFHSSTWVDYTQSFGSHVHPQHMVLMSDGKPAGAALGFQLVSPNKAVRFFTRKLWLSSMPLVKNGDEQTLSTFLELIIDHAYCSGCVELLLGSYASENGKAGLKDFGFNISERLEFESDLRLSEGELWKLLGAKRRNLVRKAMSLNVEIKEASQECMIPLLRSLAAESGSRVLERGGPDIVYHGPAENDPLRILVKSGHARMFFAEVEKRYISACLFTTFNRMLYYLIAGHSRAGLEAQAPTLLLWEAVKQFRNEGAARLSLGGCSIEALSEDSPEHGVYMFKRTFGARQLECLGGSLILRKTRNRVINTARALVANQQQ